MKYIEVGGNWYEMGFQQGEKFKEEIKKQFQKFCSREIWEKRGLSLGKVDIVREKILKQVKEYLPEVIEEIRGIADGAEMKFEEVQLLNFFPDIICSTSQCTNIIFTDGPDGPILGKNGDLGVSEGNPYLLRKVNSKRGYSYICCTWIGTAWAGDGMNETGLCIGSSSAPNRREKFNLKESISSYFLRREIFPYYSKVDKVEKKLSQCKIFGKNGANYACLDASGKAIIIEKAGYEQKIRYSDKNYLFCTNHYLNKELNEISIPRGEKADKNSINRYKNLIEIVPDLSSFNINNMKRILRNHSNSGAICQHGQENYLQTRISMIMVPRKKLILVADGNPCENEYVEYQI